MKGITIYDLLMSIIIVLFLYVWYWVPLLCDWLIEIGTR